MSSIFQQTPKMMIKSLKTTLNLLDILEVFIQDNGKSEKELLSAKLSEDMFPFVKQIQMISDNAKGLVSRITNSPAPKYEDYETTIIELKERINLTIEYVNSIPLENFSESINHKITLPFIPGKYQTALDYVTDYGLPNLYFHVVVAYSILRNSGVKLKKMDYINGLNLQDIE